MVVYEEWIAEQLSGTVVPEYKGRINTHPSSWVDLHCRWCDTHQGHTVWRAIDDLWQEVCKTQEVVFSHTKVVKW